ncbi:hypothetical protein [Solimicrobium silvestre]|uniref:Uncharacterized protein n=1 Tax=Solimicrobium silvestre TaxID=2099400 RepID=A0A2S9GSP6_9BURK|nr:hypothetical protein [Solimicrobium silvestre]PRC90731.1 hypothetical protein S2091_4557 [Solimicrobium silvestre]
MKMPQGVKQAEIGIWATIAVSALVSLIDKLQGFISEGEFFFALILYSVFCIFPYKIARGSNPARYIFAVLTAFSILGTFAVIAQVSKLDLISTILLLPVQAFIFYRLFHHDATDWFGSAGKSIT